MKKVFWLIKVMFLAAMFNQYLQRNDDVQHDEEKKNNRKKTHTDKEEGKGKVYS